MLKLNDSLLNTIKDTKNLLAFSAGVDSTALFYLLVQNHISFDIAIVNYQMRQSANNEYLYAHTLAQEHNLICHGLECKLSTKNVEQEARHIRYGFFEQLIKTHHYDTLLMAHQLNDKLEWFLMQMCKGSSLKEMVGMLPHESRGGYDIIRPLLQVSRDEIYAYLHHEKLHYFEDESNQDEHFLRNYFRHNHSNALISNYKEGILRSFDYLQEESKELFVPTTCNNIHQLYYFKRYNTLYGTIKMVDTVLKNLGVMLHHKERTRLKEEMVLVAARKYAVVIAANEVYITPYIKAKGMDKAFKERCRSLGIHPLLRGYLFEDATAFSTLCELLESL